MNRHAISVAHDSRATRTSEIVVFPDRAVTIFCTTVGSLSRLIFCGRVTRCFVGSLLEDQVIWECVGVGFMDSGKSNASCI